jgi:hypothetical protein
MRKKYDCVFVRITEDQSAALESARAAHQRRTGRHLQTAEIVRGALSVFCREEGTSFPSFHERRTKETQSRAIPR